MNDTSENITIHIRSDTLKRTYVTTVFNGITVGEFVRNCCVNLAIDPDTINGITTNVRVWIINQNDGTNQTHLDYDPYQSLRRAGINHCDIIRIEPCK